MHNAPADTLGALVGLSGIIVAAFVFLVAVFWPLLMLSAVLSLRSIRKELERLNNTIESKFSIR